MNSDLLYVIYMLRKQDVTLMHRTPRRPNFYRWSK